MTLSQSTMQHIVLYMFIHTETREVQCVFSEKANNECLMYTHDGSIEEI